jgi:cytidyltransferase-like protein
MNQATTLGTIFAHQLTDGTSTASSIAGALGLDAEEMETRLVSLREAGFVRLLGDEVQLTGKGRRQIRVVFIGGGFEIIHAGHLHTVEKAKELGDVLVAVVARDATIRARKGRKPIVSENQRVKLLSALRQVDAAILGGKGNIYETLERVRPDVVALGYDQHHQEGEISKEAARRGIRLKVIRLGSPHPSIKTTRLLQEL